MKEQIVDPNLRMVVTGSGVLRSSFSELALDLTGAAQPNVLLVATAKHTAERHGAFIVKATEHFTKQGADVESLHDHDQPPTLAELEEKVEVADLIWVSGGSTQRMMDFWKEHRITQKLAEVVTRGTVVGGGSAGMLAWFEQGHSDSLSYTAGPDEPWDYVFVAGMGYVAATGCPHYDGKTGSAELRANDFGRKFHRNVDLPNPGIGICNRAALVVDRTNYRVVTAAADAYVSLVQRTESGLEAEKLPVDSEYAEFSF